MRCLGCWVTIHFEAEQTWVCTGAESTGALEIGLGRCPACKCAIAVVRTGEVSVVDGDVELTEASSWRFLMPTESARPLPEEVPSMYRRAFDEACAVSPASPRASAALSRRILQQLLRERYHVRESDLAKEIDEFISSADAPAFLKQSVDAIRNIGNFAAHPTKSSSTGEIADVEEGEAEWSLEVLEALFEHTFVNPAALERRRKALNDKLLDLRKAPMKGDTTDGR